MIYSLAWLNIAQKLSLQITRAAQDSSWPNTPNLIERHIHKSTHTAAWWSVYLKIKLPTNDFNKVANDITYRTTR